MDGVALVLRGTANRNPGPPFADRCCFRPPGLRPGAKEKGRRGDGGPFSVARAATRLLDRVVVPAIVPRSRAISARMQ